MRFNNTDTVCYINVILTDDDGVEHKSKNGAKFANNVAEGLLTLQPDVILKLLSEGRIRLDIQPAETEKSSKKVSFS